MSNQVVDGVVEILATRPLDAYRGRIQRLRNTICMEEHSKLLHNSAAVQAFDKIFPIIEENARQESASIRGVKKITISLDNNTQYGIAIRDIGDPHLVRGRWLSLLIDMISEKFGEYFTVTQPNATIHSIELSWDKPPREREIN
jgi:hypothetical protein